MSFSVMNEIGWRNVTMIYLNGKTTFYKNCKEDNNICKQAWGQFGMKVRMDGSILQFLKTIIPPDIALICYQADYHFNIPSSYTQKYIQVNRYWGLNNAIVIPGDDLFFDNYKYYLPTININYDERINKVFWRGACTSPTRLLPFKALIDNPNCDLKLTRRSGHNQKEPWKSLPSEYFGEIVDKDEPCKYKIWLSLEGWGTASDTSRALLSGCAVIYCRFTKPWFNEFLKHEENCVIIENNNIEQLKFYVEKMINDTEYTKSIAKKGLELAHRIFQPDFMREQILKQIIMII